MLYVCDRKSGWVDGFSGLGTRAPLAGTTGLIDFCSRQDSGGIKPTRIARSADSETASNIRGRAAKADADVFTYTGSAQSKKCRPNYIFLNEVSISVFPGMFVRQKFSKNAVLRKAASRNSPRATVRASYGCSRVGPTRCRSQI